MNSQPINNGLDRRKFLKVSGGLTFIIASGLGFQMCSPNDVQEISETAINAWVKIISDGSVIIYNPAVEMGQGSFTALPVIVAEEMNADWSKVKIEYSPIDKEVYGHDGWGLRQMMLTVGSYAVQGYFQNLRVAGTQVRMVLESMAAEIWQCPVEEVTTQSGYAFHHSSDRKMSYGELVTKGELPAAIREVSPSDFKRPEDYSIIGTVFNRRDIPEKVDGSAAYSIDLHLPNMVYGVIERAPVYGSAPELLNQEEIEKLSGILKVVPIDYGIGIIAEQIEQAFSAKKKLRINWKRSGSPYNSEEALLKYPEVLAKPDSINKLIYETGDIKHSKSVTIYQASYYNDHVYHAQMEPLNATVSYSKPNQSAEIWIGTQAPDSTRRNVAKQLGIEESAVKVHRCYLGGGFGRRTKQDFVTEACLLAKETDRPVKLIWTREDDVKSGIFRAASLQNIKAGIDKNGNIITWQYQVAGSGKVLLHTGARPYYKIPNQKIEAAYLDHHAVRIGSWRAESHGHNKYAIEAFVDELAAHRNIDPLAFRQNLLKGDPRALKVLNKVAEMAQWESEIPSGRARGISFCERSAITACIVEISLEADRGKIRVHKVWFAMDAGLVIHPDNAKAQLEGGIIMGISSSLFERITFKDNQVEQSNFHDYQPLRYVDVPEEIHTEIIASTEKPVGVGEASTPGIGGAIANAFAKLTGKRLYHMPFSPKRVRNVLS